MLTVDTHQPVRRDGVPRSHKAWGSWTWRLPFEYKSPLNKSTIKGYIVIHMLLMCFLYMCIHTKYLLAIADSCLVPSMLLVAASPSQTNFLVIPRLLDMIWCNFCSFNLVLIRMDTNLKNFLLKSLFSTHKMGLGIKEKKKKICLALVYPLFLHQTVTNKIEKQLHWTF